MQYFINSKDGSLQAAQNCGDKKPFFTFMSTAEFHKCKEQLPYYNYRIIKNFFTVLDRFVIVRQRFSKTASSEHYACLKKVNSVHRSFPSAFI